MSYARSVAIVLMLFGLPAALYFSGEYLLGQLVLFSQLIVIWGLLPFIFRREKSEAGRWPRRVSAVTALIVAGMIIPFLAHLGDRSYLRSTDINKSAISIFSESSEGLLVLGTTLATLFVIATLIKRRGAET